MLCPFLEGGFGPTVDIDDYSAGLLESVIPAYEPESRNGMLRINRLDSGVAPE